MPSTPVGYADDLATGCINANMMDIVYQYGCTWRYEFNARKSGVLIFGDDTPLNRRADQMREFNLGYAKVKERLNYDHVGVRTSVLLDDVSGKAERVAKAKTTFNAATGLGIRRNGLTIYTCNIIFWSIAVPTALYGCEVWCMSKKAIDLLESFQVYAAKKIQRFYAKVPNACCLYALGWIRLERFVQVKKMLFIRSILVLDDQTLSRKIFCERATVLFENEGHIVDDAGFSLVNDLLNTAVIFNLWNEVWYCLVIAIQNTSGSVKSGTGPGIWKTFTGVYNLTCVGVWILSACLILTVGTLRGGTCLISTPGL